MEGAWYSELCSRNRMRMSWNFWWTPFWKIWFGDVILFVIKHYLVKKRAREIPYKNKINFYFSKNTTFELTIMFWNCVCCFGQEHKQIPSTLSKDFKEFLNEICVFWHYFSFVNGTWCNKFIRKLEFLFSGIYCFWKKEYFFLYFSGLLLEKFVIFMKAKKWKLVSKNNFHYNCNRLFHLCHDHNHILDQKMLILD